MSILTWIFVGLVSGWLASIVMKGSGYGLIGDIIIGIVGALVGGWLSQNVLGLGVGVSGFNLSSILVAFGGAVVVLFLLRVLKKK